MTQPRPAAGWYSDPGGAPVQRYFDGWRWTEHTLTPPAPRQRRLDVDLSAQPGDWIPQYQPPVAPQPPREVVIQGPDTTIHLVLTILTCGLWLPIWIIAALVGKRKVTYR